MLSFRKLAGVCASLVVMLLGVADTFLGDPALADTVQLTNGDMLHGRVISIDERTVRIESEILGEFALSRDKIVGIVFGDAKAIPTVEPSRGEIIEPPAPEYAGVEEGAKETGDKKQETPAEIIKRLAAPDFGPKAVAELQQSLGKPAVAGPNGAAEATPEDVVRQLRAEGLDPRLMNELQLRLPGFAAPEVQSYFNDSVGGLISGSLSIQDIRDDAIDARDQLLDLKKDLGPDAAALDGYLGILEGFIRTTAPAGDEDADRQDSRQDESRRKPARSKAPPMAVPLTPPNLTPTFTPMFTLPPQAAAPPMSPALPMREAGQP